MPDPEVRYCKTSDGVRIAVSITGDGPPLVLIPNCFGGLQPGSILYPEALRSLATSFRLVEFDSRGCGFSERAIRDFPLDSMVRDLEAVMEYAGFKASALCALADGVQVAIAYAAAWPEQVSHLILVDGWSQPSDLERTPSWRLNTAMREQDWTLYTETLASVLLGFQDAASAQRLAEHMRSSIDQDALSARNAAYDGWDVSGLLSSVSAPTLVVQNRNHPEQDTEAGRCLAAGIPGARLIELDEPLPLARERLPALIRTFLEVEGPPPDAVTPADDDRILAPGGLRTVLFTDLVGHTEMMQRLGDDRGRDVLREHERITRETLKQYAGEEVKTMGDGFLASFGSVTKAMDCAIALQRAFASHSESMPEPLHVRVGLNAGEPIEEDGDLFGSTVILASRIAAKASPDEILIPEPLRHLLSGKSYVYADRGETMLKGFEDAVRLYEVRWRE